MFLKILLKLFFFILQLNLNISYVFAKGFKNQIIMPNNFLDTRFAGLGKSTGNYGFFSNKYKDGVHIKGYFLEDKNNIVNYFYIDNKYNEKKPMIHIIKEDIKKSGDFINLPGLSINDDYWQFQARGFCPQMLYIKYDYNYWVKFNLFEILGGNMFAECKKSHEKNNIIAFKISPKTLLKCDLRDKKCLENNIFFVVDSSKLWPKIENRESKVNFGNSFSKKQFINEIKEMHKILRKDYQVCGTSQSEFEKNLELTWEGFKDISEVIAAEIPTVFDAIEPELTAQTQPFWDWINLLEGWPTHGMAIATAKGKWNEFREKYAQLYENNCRKGYLPQCWYKENNKITPYSIDWNNKQKYNIKDKNEKDEPLKYCKN